MRKLSPQECVALFDMALNKTGYTSTHSYLMFNQDPHLIELSYRIMETSNKYSEKQLDYVSTMLIVKPIHDMLMEKGGLTSEFDESDRKRYSSVVIGSAADDPLLNFVCINYSEHGLRTTGGDQLDIPDDKKLPPDYTGIMSMLQEGDHLIRYMSKPYFDKYGDDTWIPVALRDGDQVDPLAKR